MDKEYEGFEEFQDNGETLDIVSMTDEDGNNVDFLVIDAIDVDKTKYLLVVEAESADDEESDATILKEVSSEGEDAVYELVENDDEFNKVVVLFQDNETDYEMEF